MNLPALPKPKGLTPSQQRNLVALIAGAALTLNEHWPQVTALVGLHYHGLPIPPGVTAALQIASFGVTSLSRALNRSKSGTGTGIIGDASAAPVLTAAPAAPTPQAVDVSPFVAALSAALSTAANPPALTRVPPTVEEALQIVKDAALNKTNMTGLSAADLGQAAPPAQASTVGTVTVISPSPFVIPTGATGTATGGAAVIIAQPPTEAV